MQTGYFLDDPLEMRRLECEYDVCDCLVHELLPRMELGELKKMLATLKPLAKDAYKAAMAAREGKDAAAVQKVVRALFEHIPRGAILSAYAQATNTNWHPDVSDALARQKRARQEHEGI